MGLAENLKRLRAKERMSQTTLAKEAGVSQQLISQIERGDNASTKELARIARALGAGLKELDPRFVGVVVTTDAARDELNEIYDRLEGHPEWREYLVEHARELESRVLGKAARRAPKSEDA